MSSLEQLRNKVTRKDLKAVTKIYEAHLAEDHGKGGFYLSNLCGAIPAAYGKEACSYPDMFSEQLKL